MLKFEELIILIQLKNISFSYEKNSPIILDNINLTIPKGTYLSVLGDNGSCKTTLIKLILGLLSPKYGKISIATSKISYVPQRIDSLNTDFPISVYEILKSHAKVLHLDINTSICNALKCVNMSEFKNTLIGNLSGGQQQRIFIARALMGSPELIILDEPSTGIDHKNQIEIYSILQVLNKKNGTTIISIEHNLASALAYSTHILRINNGILNFEPIKKFKESCHVAEGDIECFN